MDEFHVVVIKTGDFIILIMPLHKILCVKIYDRKFFKVP